MAAGRQLGAGREGVGELGNVDAKFISGEKS